MDLYNVVKKARFLACWKVALAMNSIFSLKLKEDRINRIITSEQECGQS